MSFIKKPYAGFNKKDGECCVLDNFALSAEFLADTPSPGEYTLRLTLENGDIVDAPVPAAAFTDVTVQSFTRHPQALTDVQYEQTIRITLTDLTTFDLDLKPILSPQYTAQTVNENDVSHQIPIPLDTLVVFKFVVTGIETLANETFVHEYRGSIRNIGGTTTLVGSDYLDEYVAEDAAVDLSWGNSWTSNSEPVEVVADDGTDSIGFNFRGQTGRTINWTVVQKEFEIINI